MTVPTIAIVAFIKVYLIGIYFIELRYAPRVLKLNFNAYQLRRGETGAPMWSYVELLAGLTNFILFALPAALCTNAAFSVE